MHYQLSLGHINDAEQLSTLTSQSFDHLCRSVQRQFSLLFGERPIGTNHKEAVKKSGQKAPEEIIRKTQ